MQCLIKVSKIQLSYFSHDNIKYRFHIREQLKELINNISECSDLNMAFKIGENSYRTLPYHNNLTDSEIKGLSFDISEMLISCEFNTVSCGVEDFVEIWNYHYGRCYQFNVKKTITSK